MKPRLLPVDCARCANHAHWCCRHVNIGPQYQAEIPALVGGLEEALKEQNRETLLWNPAIAQELSEEEGERPKRAINLH